MPKFAPFAGLSARCRIDLGGLLKRGCAPHFLSAEKSNRKLDTSSRVEHYPDQFVHGLSRLRLYCKTGSAASSQCPEKNISHSQPGKEHVFRVSVDDVSAGMGKVRLDAFLCGKLEEASRAKVQASIKEGLVTINGQPLQKAAHAIRLGDVITCRLPTPRRLEAEPEAIPLEIVHEDEHLLIVNKAAGMVVHPSPGHYSGTLVNALLHHCSLPAMHLPLGAQPPLSLLGGDGTEDGVDPEDDAEDASFMLMPLHPGEQPVIRPGIVHRLDKGTSGLLVVAKDDVTHSRLCDQFKARTVERSYLSITIGVPRLGSGVVETNIGRDVKDRKKMAPFGFHSSRGRHAVSGFQVVEQLAGGRAALVQWRLQTGRTHQIRVHAKHSGTPVLGDDTYGGGASTAVSLIAGKNAARQQAIRKTVKDLQRQALHAQTLGFEHPITRQRLRFVSELPTDFAAVLSHLRQME